MEILWLKLHTPCQNQGLSDLGTSYLASQKPYHNGYHWDSKYKVNHKENVRREIGFRHYRGDVRDKWMYRVKDSGSGFEGKGCRFRALGFSSSKEPVARIVTLFCD